MTMVDPGRFPNIVGALREAGLDPMTRRVPVAPAAHYVMGGIVTDLDGRTSVERLYAVGECACTGLHGANRLASNSLSECFVFGRRAALAGLDDPEPDDRRHDRRRDRAADAARPARPSGAWPAWSATRRGSTSSTTTRTRSPGSSPPPRSPARRPAAPTAAPSSPIPIPALDQPPHAPRPRHRDPALRGMDGLLIDWGGVLTTSMMGSFDAFSAPRGPRRARGPPGIPRRARRAPGADRPRERRHPDLPSSSAGSPRRSSVDPTASPSASPPTCRPTRRCSPPSSATTTPASGPRSSRTPGRAPTTTRLERVRRRRALPGARNPQARRADLHDRARAPRTPRRALRLRR